jgi:hypothetical protein
MIKIILRGKVGYFVVNNCVRACRQIATQLVPANSNPMTGPLVTREL